MIPTYSKIQRAPRQQRGLSRFNRQLIWLIGICGAASLALTWYIQSRLPVDEQRRQAEDVLWAQPSPAFCGMRRPTKVVAHGGDTTSAPPNTAKAFQAALDRGADCIEVDTALTKDQKLVVMHIRELWQLMGHSGVQVGDYNAADLLKLRWPSGEPVMLVGDAIRLAAAHLDCIILDVKTYQDKAGQPMDELQISEALVRLVHDTACNNCIIWAKSDRVVQHIRDISPGQRTGYIVMNDTAESQALGLYKPLRMQGPELVGVQHSLVEPQLRDLLHVAGKDIFTWTVNDAQDLKRVLDVGVDAIVTNYPTMALDAIEYRLSRCGKFA